MSVLQSELHLPLVLLPLVLLLQLSCIVTVTCTGDAVTMLRKNLKCAELALSNLVAAERDYVQHIFDGSPPPKYKRQSLDRIPGITIPVGNSSTEVRDAVCSISDYLERQIPAIVGNVTRQHCNQLRSNITAFHNQFKAAVELTAHQLNASTDGAFPECHRSIDSKHIYELKILGLRIIYYTRTWVEDFTSSQPTCD